MPLVYPFVASTSFSTTLRRLPYLLSNCCPNKPTASFSSLSSATSVISEAQIQAIVRRIVEGYQPDRIILFGSYAYGTPTEDSDLDLLVIKADDSRRKIDRIVDVRTVARNRDNPAIDVFVLNEEELDRVRRNRFLVEYKALQDGRELYAAA
ncbi:DNA polymerase subunit beta [Hymenobacter amundsenii]|uniref:DNA polymerase subunit beta n=1 Tax=Hymenobacter amundsenii TaxID=2006685 RepID=A0A246FNR1_9BACT|nr:DNA polymerase subunit beta [Hymenobacter amundsenii]